MRMLPLLCWCAIAAAPAADGLQRADAEALLAEAQTWLLTQAQPTGALVPGNTFTLGITAFTAGALAMKPSAVAPTAPELTKAVAFVAGFKQKDGGVYVPDEGLGVYSTSLALILASRLAETERQGLDVTAMQNYLFAQQNPDATALGGGGIGYGDKGKSFEDLSNTGYAIQALKTSGVPANDPHMQAAIAFLERCQDLSAVNKQPWVKNSGGGVYGPQDAKRSWEKGDESQSARWTPSGTMTYELISSYLTLDLKPDDPRVQAALGWVRQNYGFDANPGMGPGKEAQGLFHAYALSSTTFALLGTGSLDLPNGRSADWRVDLYHALATRAQHSDLPGGKRGAFWINSSARWAEGIPALCTAYAVRALKGLLAEQAPGH